MADRRGDGAGVDKPEDWKFTQWFRKMQSDANRPEEGDDYDHLTAVEFSDDGKFLATGDRSGNIVILENDSTKSSKHVHYTFYGEFTSHFPDFDFVRSQPVDEKINQIKFGPRTNDSLYMLTTNDKSIKLWRVKESEQYKVVNWNIDPSPTGGYNQDTFANYALPSAALPNATTPIIKELKIPKKVVTERAKVPHVRKMYAPDVHEYNITSLSVSGDKESFVSGDSLRINLWDFSRANQSYNVVDIRPDDMNELSEIISSVDFHPSQSHLFLYSTSLGNIMTCDLRVKALVDDPTQIFSRKQNHVETVADINDPQADQQSFFDEMTQNVTAAKFSKGGRFIISRDYMSVKIWDVRNEKRPVEIIYVHEYLRERMWDLYSQDRLWDPFGLGISSSGDIVTGSYHNYFHVFDLGEKKDTFIEASKPSGKTVALGRSSKPKPTNYGNAGGGQSQANTHKQPKKGIMAKFLKRGKKNKGSKHAEKESLPPDGDDYPHVVDFDTLQLDKKIIDCAWHPERSTVAIAGQNNLYLYSKTTK